jgi:nucleoside-diphosphate-sugar epimerase
MNNRILVTGCTGMVGHGICYYFLNKDYEIWGTSRGVLQSRHKNFHPLQMDLTRDTSIKEMNKVLKHIDFIIHNAAMLPSEKNNLTCDESYEYINANFLGTYKLLKLALDNKIKQFIYISGTAVTNKNLNYINETSSYFPANEYISSKISGEIVCQQFNIEKNLNTAIFRISAPYGYIYKQKAVIPNFIHMAKNNQNLTIWGSGRREQVFTFVEDIGIACELAIKKSATGIYNITGEESISTKKLAESVLSVFKSSKSKIIFSDKPDPQEDQRINISIEKARKELDYQSVFNIIDGLQKIANADDSIKFFNIWNNEDYRWC